jgi:large subunit ribosomal protein L10
MKPASKGIRPEKQSMAAELDARISGAQYLILADYTGMDMPQTDELKKSLRENDASFNVVKNRMLKRAFKDEVAADLLRGQTALIYGSGDMVEAAKALRSFSEKNTKPAIKGGFLEGKMISGDEVIALSKLPSKDILRAMLLGTLQAPCTQLVGVLNQKVSSIVYVLDAARTKKEQEA